MPRKMTGREVKRVLNWLWEVIRLVCLRSFDGAMSDESHLSDHCSYSEVPVYPVQCWYRACVR